jgi:hypothetical protein
MIRVTELANLCEVRCLRTADRVAFLAIVHVGEILASARIRPHPVTLEARRMSLLDSQLVLARVRFFDSLMTIGAPSALTRG